MMVFKMMLDTKLEIQYIVHIYIFIQANIYPYVKKDVGNMRKKYLF